MAWLTSLPQSIRFHGDGVIPQKIYERELDDHAFFRSLSTIPPDEIIRLSTTEFILPMRIAHIIRDGYNRQQRGGRKLPYRFKD